MKVSSEGSWKKMKIYTAEKEKKEEDGRRWKISRGGTRIGRWLGCGSAGNGANLDNRVIRWARRHVDPSSHVPRPDP